MRSQDSLFAEAEPLTLNASQWHGSFNGRESTLQQLSPYVGKLKSGMVSVLLDKFTQPGDVVLDPFSGSGVVPFEAVLAHRVAYANDLSPYAYTITRAKLEAPKAFTEAIKRATLLIDEVANCAPQISLEDVPEWVQAFYHPKTLQEILAAFQVLRQNNDYFLIGCLLGILHHQRPGFLSFPSSHLVPYLRVKSFPPNEFPDLYNYRDLKTRLLKKVERAYRRALLPTDWNERHYQVWQTNSMAMPIEDGAVDAIISSPPYFGALDYARDNRLRLWFLGHPDWKQLDSKLTANSRVYLPQMSECLKEMNRLLKPGGYCVLVLGDVERDGKSHRTAEILRDLAIDQTAGELEFDFIHDDVIPDERRTRRLTKTTRYERILVMHKTI